jgi:hypothetical protein
MDIRQDVFPATVLLTAPDSTVDPLTLSSSPPTKGPEFRAINTARVVVHQNKVLIATDGVHGPDVVFSEEIDPEQNYKNPDRTGDSYVVTVSGARIVFKKDTTCGCGSRLRSWNPFRYASSIKDPTE